MKNRKHTQRNQRVVKSSEYCSDTIDPFKAKRDINQHPAKGIKGGKHRLLPKIVTNLRADRLSIPNFEFAGKTFVESLSDRFASLTGVCVGVVRAFVLHQKFILTTQQRLNLSRRYGLS